MHMMHILDDGDVRNQIRTDLADLQFPGNAFKQHMRRILHQKPGAAQHQQPDQDREKRVDQHPADRQDDHRRADGRSRTEHVAQHVQEGAAEIQVVSVGSLEHDERGDVDNKAKARHRQHRAGEHLSRVDEPVGCFGEDPAHDEYKVMPLVKAARTGKRW